MSTPAPTSRSSNPKPHPDWRKGDFTILSSDGVKFQVDKLHVFAASPVFRGGQDFAPGEQQLFVDFSDADIEHSGTVAAFLELVVHGRLRRDWAAMPPTAPCLAATHLVDFLRKYECDAALRTLRAVFAGELLHAVPTIPVNSNYSLETFALAVHLDDPELAAKAVQAHVTFVTAQRATKHLDGNNPHRGDTIDPLHSLNVVGPAPPQPVPVTPLRFSPRPTWVNSSVALPLPFGYMSPFPRCHSAAREQPKRPKRAGVSVSPKDIPLNMMPFIEGVYFWALSASCDESGRRWTTPTAPGAGAIKGTAPGEEAIELTSADGIVFKVPPSAITRAFPAGTANATAQTLHAALDLLTWGQLQAEWISFTLPERCRRIVALVCFLQECGCDGAIDTLKAKHGTDAENAHPRMQATFPLQAFVLGAAAGDAGFCERVIRGNDDAFTVTDSLDLTRDTARTAASLLSSYYWKCLARSHAVANGSKAKWATAFRNLVEEGPEDDDSVDEGGSVLSLAAVAFLGMGGGKIIQWAKEVSVLRANAWIALN
ncbi:uncharacterized protein LOC62_03G004114 [Vanrija pseudolonga]|uniref:BTB domain-containing protein n=1 Tax=Vanrija pseudolonga TaxID=143232 RepID=A0AAF0YBH6_9TREE|nr:hypothetical protein LOC62_03G004114 [Vanrija pseudolonga]